MGPWDRVLGLDIGERRIGLAFSSTLSVGNSLVLPAGFLLVDAGEDKALADLCDLAAEEGVGAVVVGVPYVGGLETRQTQKVLAFATRLRAVLPEKVEMFGWDESYSSASAQSLLVDAELKHSGKAKRGRVDAVAASLILQSFVDAHRNLGVAPGAVLF
ncbi:MAG: Holliday junction resolvase RuvX [bacterium]